jgi:hypothetical protein
MTQQSLNPEKVRPRVEDSLFYQVHVPRNKQAQGPSGSHSVKVIHTESLALRCSGNKTFQCMVSFRTQILSFLQSISL